MVFSSEDLPSGPCPHFTNAISAAASNPQLPLFKFGRMFDDRPAMIKCLTELGAKMGTGQSQDSNNPSGYTYLGQFIAHEITFDRTKGLPETNATPDNYRSPQIDLDSLYGNDNDPDRGRLYQTGNPALLKLGMTVEDEPAGAYYNDLFRDPETGVAVIADERNDENLAVAQVQVAFIHFHNTIVARLADSTPPAKLFDTARTEVVKHFQWILLHDYLATLLDKDVLKNVLTEGPRFFKPDKANLFMPLEFSVAAFRLGHSMVRGSYEWNYFHSSELDEPARIDVLFRETNFSGLIRPGNARFPLRLLGRWIIDWRRFFEFGVIQQSGQPVYTPVKINYARRIDTTIDMGLELINEGFHHDPFKDSQKSIAVRNLLRGYALRLPTGEEVAEWMGEPVLSQVEIANGYQETFNSRWLKGKTPLWYYILREAELCHSGDRLGPVGSRIVAETFFTLIKNSRYSILNEPDWRPRTDASHLDAKTGERVFQMVDLLHFADVVNPIRM